MEAVPNVHGISTLCAVLHTCVLHTSSQTLHQRSYTTLNHMSTHISSCCVSGSAAVRRIL